MKNKSYLILTYLLLFSLLISADKLFSYPKFAAVTGEKCVSCHVNPTGGGMRNKYGIKTAKDFLYWKFLEKANKETELNTDINKSIQVGSDFRMIFINNQQGEGTPDFNTFFQMQAELYVHAQISKYLSLNLNPGFLIPNTFGNAALPVKTEIYGMVHNLPAGLYLKVGRFIPNFGIKIPEHRSFNRNLNGFYTPYAADAGFEVGIAPSLFTLTVGLSNGSSRDINGTLVQSYDFDAQKQFTTSADFRWASKKGDYSFGLGGSFINNPFKYDPANNINALRQIAAGFISIGLFKRVAILGEYDYNRLDLRDAGSTRHDFNTIFGEVDITVVQGAQAKFQFESYDPNLGLKDGPQELRRYSFGINLFPLTGLEIESIYRVVDEPGELDIKNNEFQETFKIYF
ncbi:MAG: hypothetical protein EHM58_15000 [Ignavibacteriae bacterium]|nr:MAG: hypothetical protein EHM58_15000 [Ignavibacteriota bacterium]